MACSERVACGAEAVGGFRLAGGCVRPPSASYKGLLLSLPASAVCDGDTSIRLLTSSKYLLDLARLSLTATTTVVMVSALLYSGGVGNIT